MTNRPTSTIRLTEQPTNGIKMPCNMCVLEGSNHCVYTCGWNKIFQERRFNQLKAQQRQNDLDELCEIMEGGNCASCG